MRLVALGWQWRVFAGGFRGSRGMREVAPGRRVRIMTADSNASSVRVEDLSVFDLMRLHRQTLYELLRRGVVRTLNQPQGDWAETLVKVAYDGQLAAKSEKGYDVLTPDGTRLQVKARALDHHNVGSNTTSFFRSWEFDAMVIVLLDPNDLSVARAAELPLEAVYDKARYVEHVNGHVLSPNDALMSEGIDVTDRLRAAAHSL